MRTKTAPIGKTREEMRGFKVDEARAEGPAGKRLSGEEQKKLDEELSRAAYRLDRCEVERLVKAGADKDGVLHLICGTSYEKREKREVVKLLLDCGADPNTRPKWGHYTSLIHACVLSDKELADTLIAHGAHVDGRDVGGNTALMHVVSLGEIELAEMLIARGADVNAKNENGSSVLKLAKKHQNHRAGQDEYEANKGKIIGMLLEAGATE